MALFIIYCIDGELDNIKKISLKNCDLECGFRWACRNGHCDIIQYLVNLYKTDINGNINTYVLRTIRKCGLYQRKTKMVATSQKCVPHF
jgi:hypothetical protein